MQFIRLRARSNEDFVWTLPTQNLAGGAVVTMQFRRKGGDPDPAPLSFSSDGSQTGTVTLDIPNQALYFFAPASAMADLDGQYLFDVIVVQSGRRDAVAAGTCLVITGETTL